MTFVKTNTRFGRWGAGWITPKPNRHLVVWGGGKTVVGVVGVLGLEKDQDSL